MHVKAKQMAFGGLILAVTVVCMALGSVIETNTLFLLAAAAFFVGIVIREFGLRTGAAFYLAAILLGFLVTPNKFYVITFAAMGFYILGIEAVWIFLAKRPQMGHRMGIYWLVKYFRIPLDAVSESSVRSVAFGSCNGWTDSNIVL